MESRLNFRQMSELTLHSNLKRYTGDEGFSNVPGSLSVGSLNYQTLSKNPK